MFSKENERLEDISPLMLNGPDASNEKLQNSTRKDTFICVELLAFCINSNTMFEIPALKHNKVI